MRLILCLVAAALVLQGCTIIGTGDHTLIKARLKPEDMKALDFFPAYLAEPGEPVVQVTKGIGRSRYSSFESYMNKKYGGVDAEVSHMGVVTRDKSKTPDLLPVAAVQAIAGQAAKVPEKLEDMENAIAREEFVKARLLNTPRLPNRTVFHHDSKGHSVYFYYPQVEIDLSGSVLTPNPDDRFSFLGMAVRLCSGKKDGAGNKIRFIDVSPKAADLAQFSRGNFSLNTSLQSKLNASAGLGMTMAGGLTVGDNTNPAFPVSGNIGGSGTLGLNAGAETSFTLSETYACELKDTLERQKVGIIEDGQTFIAELRGLREYRIGGTYTFDLLIEVPAVGKTHEDGTFELKPIERELYADIYLVGVVRHVYEPGAKGVLTRVPESENDDVYEQVIYRKVSTPMPIWRYNGVPWAEADKTEKPEFEVQVISNRKDAAFYLADEKTHRVVDSGSGEKGTLTGDKAGTYRVFFLKITEPLEHGDIRVLSAAPSEVITISEDCQPASVIVTGEYKP